MKIKRFNESFMENDDLSNVESITFHWNNKPTLSDYKDASGEYGDPNLRIKLNNQIIDSLGETTKDHFKSILLSNKFNVKEATGGYLVELIKNSEVIRFFNLIDDIKYE